MERIVDLLDDIKDDVESFGGFQTEALAEDFLDNIEGAVVSVEDCIENLEADEAVSDLRS